jgi:hypothetical protein
MDSYNNNINDPFKQFVKSKLADYKEDVPPSGWEKLESKLYAAQKRKVLRTKRLASSVLAVAAALIGVFFVFQNMNRELPIKTSENLKILPIEKKKPSKAKQDGTKVEAPIEKLLADYISTSNVAKDIIVYDESSDKSENINDLETMNTNNEKDRDKLTEVDEKTKQQLIQDFINEGNRGLSVAEDSPKGKKRNRHSISLFGNSGLSSSQQTNTDPATLRSSVSDSYGKYTLSKMVAYNVDEEVNPESETNHMQPISFGLLTSFDITNKLQIETGLLYTYLSSETKNKSSDFNNSEKVQFHYLGIPLNVNYTVLSVNKLNLYVTGGAMIEKDIYGKIKYNDEKKLPTLNSGFTNESSSKIKQKNPQFSLAGGLGVTYPLYDRAKLFGKMGGRYYIDTNNEYKTYYSDEKFGLDIQLGIKFNF